MRTDEPPSGRQAPRHYPPAASPSSYTQVPRSRAPRIWPSPFRFAHCLLIVCAGPKRQGIFGYIEDIDRYFPKASQRTLIGARGVTFIGLPLLMAVTSVPVAVNVLCYIIWPHLAPHFILANLLLIATFAFTLGDRSGWTYLMAPFFFETPNEHRARLRAVNASDARSLM